MWLRDHVVPFHVTALPPPSTATQKLEDEHETESSSPAPVSTGADHGEIEPPLQVNALPS